MAGKPRGRPFARGNPGRPLGAVSSKPFKEALAKVAAELASDGSGGTKLDALARKMFVLALGGDTQAAKEIGNRLDGLPRQEVVGEDGGPLQVIITKFGDIDADQGTT